jgi:hypothetical protein
VASKDEVIWSSFKILISAIKKTHKVNKRDLQRMLSLNYEAGVEEEHMIWFSSIMKD